MIRFYQPLNELGRMMRVMVKQELSTYYSFPKSVASTRRASHSSNLKSYRTSLSPNRPCICERNQANTTDAMTSCWFGYPHRLVVDLEDCKIFSVEAHTYSFALLEIRMIPGKESSFHCDFRLPEDLGSKRLERLPEAERPREKLLVPFSQFLKIPS
ncbi:hypothetical protein VNO77_33928 [Canavalia gladiata]|uniref:Uncharacterized protein n=1 Tax=Canavalia gladiata TaxID=3824 RepID=A0AAN9KFT7_CANGL